MHPPSGDGLRLVGRERELAHLAAAIREGPGAVLAGEPGVGKSALARLAARQASEDGMAVDFVLATTAVSATPFGALAPLLPHDALAGRGPLGALKHAAGALSGRHRGGRLLLVVDDAQRLDLASAALILQLVSGGAATVLATVRTGERSPDAVTALWKDAGAERIEVHALSPADSERLARQVLGGRVDRRTADWLYATAGGNPHRLQALAAAGRSAGSLVHRRGRWRRVEPSP